MQVTLWIKVLLSPLCVAHTYIYIDIHEDAAKCSQSKILYLGLVITWLHLRLSIVNVATGTWSERNPYNKMDPAVLFEGRQYQTENASWVFFSHGTQLHTDYKHDCCRILPCAASTVVITEPDKRLMDFQ
jgi:hypothetical protein